MKKWIFLIFLSSIAYGGEKIALTTPLVADPRETPNLEVQMLTLDWIGSRIVVMVGQNGINRSFIYKGEQAKNMMITLNKANLSTNSLHKRILNQLISDGYLSGTISGTPD